MLFNIKLGDKLSHYTSLKYNSYLLQKYLHRNILVLFKVKRGKIIRQVVYMLKHKLLLVFMLVKEQGASLISLRPGASELPASAYLNLGSFLLGASGSVMAKVYSLLESQPSHSSTVGLFCTWTHTHTHTSFHSAFFYSIICIFLLSFFFAASLCVHFYLLSDFLF